MNARVFWALSMLSMLGCAGPASVGVDAPRIDAAARADAADAPLDAGRDAAIDAPAPRDTPRDAPSPVDAWGTCSILPQSGCAPGEACRLTPREGPTFVVPPDLPPTCQVTGALDELDECDPFHDLCAPGLYCQSFGLCVRFCDPDGDPCPPIDSGARVCTGVGQLGTRFCDWEI